MEEMFAWHKRVYIEKTIIVEQNIFMAKKTGKTFWEFNYYSHLFFWISTEHLKTKPKQISKKKKVIKSGEK